MGRYGGVSLSTRPQSSTEKEAEEPERTKNKERTQKEKPVLFLAVSSVGGTFWAVSIIGGTLSSVSSVLGDTRAYLCSPVWG